MYSMTLIGATHSGLEDSADFSNLRKGRPFSSLCPPAAKASSVKMQVLSIQLLRTT